MKRIDWNTGWRVSGAKQFLEGFGVESESLPVTLPHDAMIFQDRDPNSPNGPDNAWYNGTNITYTKTLCPPDSWQTKPVLLELEGAAQNAVVYVNGQFAGKCPYAYSGFRVNIGQFLNYGQPNTVEVVTKSGMQQTSRWYTGGGLYRPLWLLVGGAAQIEPAGVRITTCSVGEDCATVEVAVVLGHTLPGRCRITLDIILRNGEGEIAAQDTIPVTLFDQETVPVIRRMDLPSPQLWSPESPNLYEAELRLLEGETLLETQRITFGVRTLEVSRSHGMCLNGVPIKLRGACLHHDNGILGAVTLKDAELRRVRRLKRAGFNAVRSAHNPASRALLEACDEVGMLMMDELFDVWNNSKRDHDYSLSFAERWESDMRAMVEKDYNHPCVVLYTVGNEIPETGTPGGAALNRKLVNHLRQLDRTRPIVNCINGMFSVMPHMREILQDVMGGGTVIPGDINAMMTLFDDHIDKIMCHQVVTDATEETFAGVDVCGYNYMASRYIPDGAAYPNRIIVGSETNPDKIGYHWPLICRLPYVLGDFVWAGWEFIGEAGVGKNDYELTHAMYGPWPWYLAYCGDFDLCGNRRPQSYYREIVFGLRKRPYLCAERPEHYNQPKCTTNWTWSDVVESWTWPGFEGKPIHVEVYTDAEEVELICNGVPLGRARVGRKLPFRAEFDTVYTPGILTARVIRNGIPAEEMTLTTAGAAVQIALTAEKECAAADPQSLIYVDITLTDEKGQWNPAAQAQVALSVEGPAVLAGYGSADPRSLEKFSDTVRTTFDGRALAVLRAAGQPGVVTVSAQGPSLIGDTIKIQLY